MTQHTHTQHPTAEGQLRLADTKLVKQGTHILSLKKEKHDTQTEQH